MQEKRIYIREKDKKYLLELLYKDATELNDSLRVYDDLDEVNKHNLKGIGIIKDKISTNEKIINKLKNLYTT